MVLWGISKGAALSRGVGKILTYHAIDNSGCPISVRPDLFRWHMKTLKESGKRGVSLAEYVRVRAGDPGRTRNLVVLTFDDGAESLLAGAVPVLAEHGFTATVFVVTDFVGKKVTWKKKSNIPDLPLMNWQQIAECRRAGIEIGSHTRTHPNLLELGEAQRLDELQVSKAEIEQRLGQAQTTFCYPYGDYDPAAAAMARQCGYAAAVTRHLENDVLRRGVYELPRLGMNRVSADDLVSQHLYFRAALAGALPLYERMRGG